MQLLRITTGVSLALRSATNAASSRSNAVATKRAPNLRSKAAATPAASLSGESLQKQQLWELSKTSSASVKQVEVLKKGDYATRNDSLFLSHLKSLRSLHEFATIDRRLKEHARLDKDKVPNPKLVNGVLWAAVLAKSLGSLPPSILDWIENSVPNFPEPIPSMEESIIWLLSILRGDIPMLQQMQQETKSKNGVVGPEVEREKTLRYAALTYLDAGMAEEFRSLWASLNFPVLEEDDHCVEPGYHSRSALLHHAMLRSAGNEKTDRSMLRWYAESLAAHQRTPIAEDPQFNAMMIPVISSLGGRIVRWEENDVRIEKLRKWRDDYDDAELDNLVKSMLDFVTRHVGENESHVREDLKKLGVMLDRLNNEKERPAVVLDWMNWVKRGKSRVPIFPSHSLVVVGRKRYQGDKMTPLPMASDSVKVMAVTTNRKIIIELEDVCSILAVASRGHLLSNAKTRRLTERFTTHLEEESGDVGQSILLRNYLSDAAVRHLNKGKFIEPLVDHSKAAQWIDKEKKELAFTVAKRAKDIHSDYPFRNFDYYSLHLD